jgi:hypothetical protein
MFDENIVSKTDIGLWLWECRRKIVEQFLQPTRRKGIFSTNINCTWNKKLKSLGLIKKPTMMACGRVDVYLHAFLTSALDECVGSHPSALFSGTEPLVFIA